MVMMMTATAMTTVPVANTYQALTACIALSKCIPCVYLFILSMSQLLTMSPFLVKGNYIMYKSVTQFHATQPVKTWGHGQDSGSRAQAHHQQANPLPGPQLLISSGGLSECRCQCFPGK